MTIQPYKKRGVIESIKEFLYEATETSPITKKEILAKLIARFPDRAPASMKSTVNQQVPNKLRRDAGLVVKTNQSGGYWLPHQSPAHTTQPAQQHQGPPDGASRSDFEPASPSILPPPQPTPPQTIRIDPDVWHALQRLAVPFVETPNDVMRRLLGIPPM